MREINKIAEGLFEKVRDRFEDVSLGDENAKATSKPENARFFNFDYVVDGHNHGNITISIIDENSLKVYFSKNITDDLSPHEKKHWYAFLKELREFARRNLLSFDPRDITRNTLKHRDVQHLSKADDTYSKDDVVAESRLYGTSRSSYENEGPVKIIVRHTDHINPESRGARTRKIGAVFLETQDGERRKLPYNNLRYARAMARHISEGGLMEDEFGQHITELATECAKLRPFKNSMVRRVFEDDETQQMAEAAFEYHGLLNNTLKRIGGRKGYANCKEQFVATSTSYIPEEEFDAQAMRKRFEKRTFNDKLEDALPLVQKAYKMKKENKFAEQFESWANNVAESWEEKDLDEDIAGDYADETAEPGQFSSTHGSGDDGMDGMVNPQQRNVQEDEDDSTHAVQAAIIRRIISSHLDVLRKYGPEAVDQASADVAWSVGPVDEIGSSDVSAWVQETIDMLENNPEVAEDLDEETKLRKTRSPSKKASDAKYYDWLAKNADKFERDMDEGIGDDYVNKDVKMKRMGAKPLSLADKLKTIPQGAKAWKKGESEDDLQLYNKSKATNESKESKTNVLTEMKKLAGLK
jgi:hypothetical protein